MKDFVSKAKIINKFSYNNKIYYVSTYMNSNNIPCKKVFDDKLNEIEETEEIVEHEEEMHIPADTTAQIFWLKNRRPKEWRERVEVETNTEELNKVTELLNKIEQGANND